LINYMPALGEAALVFVVKVDGAGPGERN